LLNKTKMDSKTLTHIGGELVVLAGVSFYFQKKCNKLEQQNKELAEALNVLNQEFEAMYRAVKAIQDRLGNHSSHVSHSHPPQHRSSVPSSSSNSSSSSSSSSSSVPSSNSKSFGSLLTETKEPKESLEDDPELLKELERIQNERKNLETESENDCKDGVCLIKT